MRLDELCEKIDSGATPKGGKDVYNGEDYPLIRSQNILDWTFSDSGLAAINDEQAHKLDGVEVKAGDVLLNITGDSVARTCLTPSDTLNAHVNQLFNSSSTGTAVSESAFVTDCSSKLYNWLTTESDVYHFSNSVMAASPDFRIGTFGIPHSFRASDSPIK